MQELQTTQLAVLDLRAPMQSQARSTLVYHRTDTHWNAVGALLASREILSLIKQDFPQLSLPSLQDYQEKMQPFSGDLAAFLPSDERFVEQICRSASSHSNRSANWKKVRIARSCLPSLAASATRAGLPRFFL